MNTSALKEKILGYPVPAISVVVALAAAGILWYDADDGLALAAERDTLKARADTMTESRRHARNLEQDIARARVIHGKVVDRALDFDSTIATTAFAARMVRNDTVVVPGLPTERGRPVAATVKPYAQSEYSLSAEGDFPSLLAYLGEIANDPARPLVVSRVQLMADDNTAKTGRMKADIGFRVWGIVKGRPEIAKNPPPDKSVPSPESRAARMTAAEAMLARSRFDLSSATNPFGDTMSVAAVEAPGSAELEGALRAIDFTVGAIDGNPVVKFPGVLPKRLNGDVEIIAGGRTYRVRIVEIGEADFAVVTPSGKKIRISPRK